MLLLSIITLALILGAYGALYVWPQYSLWLWAQYQQRQRYHVYFEVSEKLLMRPTMVLAQTPDLMMAILLKRFTALPLYYFGSAPSEPLIRRLCQQARIEFITALPATPGIILMSAAVYQAGFAQQLPLALAYLAGATPYAHNIMRFRTRAIQLSLYPAHQDTDIPLALQYLSVHAWERYVDKLPTLIETWLKQAKALGHRLSVTDSTGVKLSHYRLIASVLLFRRKLAPMIAEQQHIGICLPNSVGGVITMLTLLSLGKTLVNLNYTADPMALATAIQEAGLRIVITSKRFIAQLQQRGFAVDDLLKPVQVVIYLEDIKASITAREAFKYYLWAMFAPRVLLQNTLVPPVALSAVAFILFSSGSEARPKGIELTQRNIIGNIRQASMILAAQSHDVLLSILPIFHAFGLTIGTMLPLIEGIPVVSHPDPIDTSMIGTLAHTYQTTVLFATSTFLRLYAKAKNLTPEMLQHLRIVVAGAERLLPEVRTLFTEKFNKIIYEGYGTTELSPVASVNYPNTPSALHQKINSVGHALPGCMFRIVDPDTGIDLPSGTAGLILVGGVNVMKGYLKAPDKTQAAIIGAQGIRWYKTGDKGSLDAQGFLTIIDRYSRFAKVGGETISLSAVEQHIMTSLPDAELEILALAVPDLKKGEMIVLLYSGPMDIEALKIAVHHAALPNIMKPHKYIQVPAIPKLGTGKTDFAAAKRLCLASL
jgi:acyl-[acyl-carrier-protein]-phospholipid O-acyltransferase/long-chain-fatty-acid--[acyl-carrier-protein] ligase